MNTKLQRHIKAGIVVFCLLLSAKTAFSQKVFDLEITGDYRNMTMIELFLDIEKHYPVRFFYEPSVLPYYKIEQEFNRQPLFSILQKMLPQHGLVSAGARDNGIIICRKGDLTPAYLNDLLRRWDEKKIEMPEFLTPYELTVQTGTPPASTEKTISVSGIVLDEQTKEPVPGIVVKGNESGIGTTTDRLGRFKLNLPPGEHLLVVNYIGYRETRMLVQAYQSGEITIPLQVRALELAGVEIVGNKAANKQTAVATGVEMLSTQTIKEIPSFMGEADVVKSLLVLPGVSTVGEGSSGFNVRGGNVDQNLVIQDELPFFNTSHVLGFFSVFNPDLVRSTTLYKGHIPARFGGRVASALDVRMRDGNFEGWHGSAGAGLASGKLTLEGPVWKDRVSVLVGARTSYSDWMLKTAKLPEVKQSSAWFNDINAKISWRVGKNGTVTGAFHRSQDYFRYAQEFGYQWRTQGGSFSWRQGWSEKFLTSITAAAGNLKNTYFLPQGYDAFTLDNGLGFRNINAQATLLFFANHEITAGVQWNGTKMSPQELTPRGAKSGISPNTVQLENGAELAAYVEDEWKITKWITLSMGLRYSHFQTLGPNDVFTYEPNAPFSTVNIVDTTRYGKNSVSQTYSGPEPRFSLNVRLGRQNSLKVSYNILRQYLHLISNTTAATPADLWQVSNRYLRPQVSDSYGAGWFFTQSDKRWETSVELFYRNTRDVPAYKDFATLLLNNHLETELINGKQKSYGAEYLFRKNTGRWTGWVSYTYSRVFQQARSPFPEISVNRGDWFPANFDQPHQAIVYAKFAVNPALYWNLNFTYRKGRPVTAPQSGYQVGNVIVPNFSDRNNLRIPDYHRLDIGLTLDKTKSKLSGLKWTLNLSMYNVYARKNPFSVFFKRDKNGLNRAYQLAVIGSTIPAANFTIYW